jgi:hypothetical protein
MSLIEIPANFLIKGSILLFFQFMNIGQTLIANGSVGATAKVAPGALLHGDLDHTFL